jgi:hypothetical protein
MTTTNKPIAIVISDAITPKNIVIKVAITFLLGSIDPRRIDERVPS